MSLLLIIYVVGVVVVAFIVGIDLGSELPEGTEGDVKLMAGLVIAVLWPLLMIAAIGGGMMGRRAERRGEG